MRARRDRPADDMVALTDVISNILGVLILIALATALDAARRGDSAVPIAAMKDVSQEISDFIVDESGVYPVDLAAAFEAAIERELASTGAPIAVAGGRYELLYTETDFGWTWILSRTDTSRPTPSPPLARLQPGQQTARLFVAPSSGAHKQYQRVRDEFLRSCVDVIVVPSHHSLSIRPNLSNEQQTVHLAPARSNSAQLRCKLPNAVTP